MALLPKASEKRLMELLMREPYGRSIATWKLIALEHWRLYRPKFSAEIGEEHLIEMAEEAARKTYHEISELMRAGFQYLEAEEMIREKYILVRPSPEEEDYYDEDDEEIEQEEEWYEEDSDINDTDNLREVGTNQSISLEFSEVNYKLVKPQILELWRKNVVQENNIDGFTRVLWQRYGKQFSLRFWQDVTGGKLYEV